jgi:hypothetical protein
MSLPERLQIADLRLAGKGVREIALELGRAPSTISRELGRNRPAQSAHGCLAPCEPPEVDRSTGAGEQASYGGAVYAKALIPGPNPVPASGWEMTATTRRRFACRAPRRRRAEQGSRFRAPPDPSCVGAARSSPNHATRSRQAAGKGESADLLRVVSSPSRTTPRRPAAPHRRGLSRLTGYGLWRGLSASRSRSAPPPDAVWRSPGRAAPNSWRRPPACPRPTAPRPGRRRAAAAGLRSRTRGARSRRGSHPRAAPSSDRS